MQEREREKLPRLFDERKREKVYSEIGARSGREDVVDRLMDAKIEDHRGNRKRNRDKLEKLDLSSEKRLMPTVLQGRLRSISPENLVKILQKEKEKQRLYSIIGNNSH